ncbi:hypothetical protein L2E82_52424 [Cichorium intybus]|nr:hypothetical protein L2E82_52424 [Cichorium intybus]
MMDELFSIGLSNAQEAHFLSIWQHLSTVMISEEFAKRMLKSIVYQMQIGNLERCCWNAGNATIQSFYHDVVNLQDYAQKGDFDEEANA